MDRCVSLMVKIAFHTVNRMLNSFFLLENNKKKENVGVLRETKIFIIETMGCITISQRYFKKFFVFYQ